MLLLLLVLLAPPQPKPAPAAAPRAVLDVQADRLEYDQKTGRVRFEGNVRATQGDLRLRCARLTARYGNDGALGDLQATGGVRVVQGELSAQARKVAYFKKDQRLVMTGDPVVTRGKDELRGATITYWPEQQRLVVEQARGRLNAPRIRLPQPRLSPPK